MKKLLLTIACAATAGVACAQKPANTIGIRLAYGRTSLAGSSDALYSAENHSVYQGGLVGDVYFAQAFSFHPEVLYSWRAFDAGNVYFNRDLSYIDVPLLARYHASGFFVEAGPQVSFPLTAKNEAGDDMKSQVNGTALDYVVGLGYQLGMGLSLGVRYDGGLTNVFKSEIPVLGSDNLKSRTFFVALGYALGGQP